MVWVFIGIVLLLAAGLVARALLLIWDVRDLAAQALAYASAAVVALQLVRIGIDVYVTSGADAAFRAGGQSRTRWIVSVLSDGLVDLAWQAGVLAGLAVLVARRRAAAVVPPAG